MLIWLLITEKVCTLYELETSWSLDDAIRVHAVMEMKTDMIKEQNRKAQNVNSKKSAN